MRTRFLAALAVSAVAAALCGAPQPKQYPDVFAKPPSAALKSLKATVGKPFSAGYVFIEGKYMPPPYKVERWGTAIRINGVQVTPEVVPWEEFIKTQKGVTVTRNESAAPVADFASEPEPEPEEEEDFDDSESTLDDLFDDDPQPKKKTVKKRKPYRPKPRKPEVTVSYAFDGEFVHNEKTRSYVERINKQRTNIDSRLRSGGYYCFGSRYRMATGDAKIAAQLMSKLPDIMKRNPDRDSFEAAMSAAGFNYLPRSLLADFFKNRIDYLQLEHRRKTENDQKQWSSILGGTL